MATRQEKLRQLAARMPVANQQAASQLQAAEDIRRKQTIGAAPPPTAPGAGGVIAAQTAGRQAQTALAAQQTTAAQSQQLGQTGLGAERSEQQVQLAESKLGLDRKAMENRSKLASLGRYAKDEVLKSRLEFNQKAGQRKFDNERMLADWQLTQVQDQEKFKNYAQKSSHTHKRKIRMMEAAHSKIAQKLEQVSKRKQTKATRAAKRDLLVAKQNMERAVKQAQADAANRNRMWSSAGMVVGAVLGSYFGPAGTAAGATAGAGAGSAVGAAMEE